MNITIFVIVLLLLSSCKKSNSGNNNNPGNGSPDTTTTPPAVVKELVLADQSQNRIIIVDVAAKTILWEWKPSATLPAASANWFTNMSDAKPVCSNQYLLITASGGGVALVRIAGKKAVFYAYAGNGNTHSAELLPDGNIVAACSTGGYLILFHTDSTALPYSGYTKKINLTDAHNVIWDKQRQLLWSAAGNKLYAYRYNFDCAHPDLVLADSIALPATGSHELFPDYGMDSLLLSTSSKVWTINLKSRAIAQISNYPRIKSISPGPSPYFTLLLQSIDTDQQWWNDYVMDANGNITYQLAGLKIYKARWLLDNAFSYAATTTLTLCK